MTEFAEILKAAGPWGAPWIIVAWCYVRGYLATGRELKQLQERLAAEIADRERERTQLTRERDKWQDIGIRSTQLAGSVVGHLPPLREGAS